MHHDRVNDHVISSIVHVGHSGAPWPLVIEGFDGNTYERANIEAWFAEGRTMSPISGELMPSTLLFSNHHARSLILEAEWRRNQDDSNDDMRSGGVRSDVRSDAAHTALGVRSSDACYTHQCTRLLEQMRDLLKWGVQHAPGTART